MIRGRVGDPSRAPWDGASEIARGARSAGGQGGEAGEKTPRTAENIVLIGMPGVGKSTVARALAARLGRPVADTDAMVAERAGLSIPEIFARFGEARFRDLESAVVLETAARSGLVVATGGGTVLREENVARLRRSGRLFLLERPLEALLPSPDRPLGDTREKVARLYWERMPVYRAAADEIVPFGETAEATAADIEGRWRQCAR